MATDFLALAASMLDMDYIKKHSLKLNELERSTDNVDFITSSKYVENLMIEAGVSEVERYAIPLDGVTTYDDCTMPYAWERTGRSTLEIVDPALPESERMLADTDVELLNAVIWSPPTPEGGVTAELIDLKSVESEDWSEVAGKIVLCNRSPIGEMRRKLALAGAVGLVSYVENTLAANPDDVRWMNGVGWCGWYYVKGNKMLWNYSITPRKGDMLAKKLASGEKITLKAVMNTRIYEGETYTVTGRIPGKSKEEIALFAHMYEPFVPDDAAGVVISIAIAKAVREMVKKGLIPPLEKSIRLVFGMERYGFSEYFHDLKRSGKIISATNMDSVCHSTLKIAGVLPELRHSPASAPCFDVALIREYLQKRYPELPYRETPGNLSDDTFGADTPFNIPTCWLHTPPAIDRHHNSGAIFAEADWYMAEISFNVWTAYLAELATVKRGRNDRSLVKRVIKAVKADAEKDLKRLAKNLKEGSFNAYAGNVIGEFLVDYFTRRVLSLNNYIAKAVKASEIRKIFAAIREKLAPASLELDVYSLTNSEARMSYMYITRNPKIRQIMSLTQMPEEERYGFIVKPSMLLQALLDGKRNLYEVYVISKFMLKESVDFKETAGLVAYFKRTAPYGYYDIKYADELSCDDIVAALKALEVKSNDKLIVHSAYGQLGGVKGGPAAVAQTLIDYCGKKGVLMMPSFNFPYYLGRSSDEYFDVKETPSSVGAISEEFRKHADVTRSLNPSHSIAVYGRKNFHWVTDHHQTLCLGEKSPLGKLEAADGYTLTIGCPAAVTFMHVVEMTNRTHCLGMRTEEFKTKLPDGRIVNTRTWGWRGGSCRAYKTEEVFDYMRKHNMVNEVMVRHCLFQYFKLSDYRKAYEKMVIFRKNTGCVACNILVRNAPHTVPSDWDSEKGCIRKNTTAFTEDWDGEL